MTGRSPSRRAGGVTRAVVAPSASRDIFAGQGALIRLSDGLDIVTRGRAFQLVELGESGAENAGGSRTASFAQFRNALVEARDFAAHRARVGNHDNLYPLADTEALVAVVDGRQPLVVHVERASDIVSVLALKTDFPKLRLILFGAREGWTVADRIAAAHVPVITSAIDDLPDAFETLASTKSNVGRLVAAGVVVGIGTSGGESTNQPRNVTQFAGNLVAQGRLPGGVGVTRDQALSLITRNPAEIFGMTDTGTIAAGKRADLVVWDGDPLETDQRPGRGDDRRGAAAGDRPPDRAARPLPQSCPRRAAAAVSAVSLLLPSPTARLRAAERGGTWGQVAAAASDFPTTVPALRSLR